MGKTMLKWIKEHWFEVFYISALLLIFIGVLAILVWTGYMAIQATHKWDCFLFAQRDGFYSDECKALLGIE